MRQHAELVEQVSQQGGQIGRNTELSLTNKTAIEANSLAIHELQGTDPAEPVDPPPPVDPPEAEYPVDGRPVVKVVELGPGEQSLSIPRDERRPDQWYVVVGQPGTAITRLNDISTPSLVQFVNVGIHCKVQGRTGGEFAFTGCSFDVDDSVCWGVSKAWVHGCDIVSRSNVFSGNVGTYDARTNTVDYYEDLIRGGFGSNYINTIVMAHRGRKGDGRDYHGDVFEIQRGQGFSGVVIDGLHGPNGQPAEFGYTQGFAGGDISNSVIRNVKARFSGEGGIHMIQVGGYWRDVSVENVVISGGPINVKPDFAPERMRVRNSPAFAQLPGVEVIQ